MTSKDFFKKKERELALIKGSNQFYNKGLHLKFEKADIKNNITFFENSYNKNWTENIVYHRNKSIYVFNFDNYDNWIKKKDPEVYKLLVFPKTN